MDFKIGSNDPAKRVTVTNNVMSGWIEGDPTVGGNYTAGTGLAISCHYGCENIDFDDNVVYGSTKFISMADPKPEKTFAVGNVNVRRNLVKDLGIGSPYGVTTHPLIRLKETENVVYEDNIFVDTVDSTITLFTVHDPIYEGNAINSNIFVNVLATPAPSANLAVDGNYYYNSTYEGAPTNPHVYSTAAEAILKSMTFYTEIMDALTTDTIEGILTTVDSPHYADANPQGVALPVETLAYATPFSIREIVGGVEYLYTDDGVDQFLYIDSVQQTAEPLIGSVYLDEVSQISGLATLERTLYEVHSVILTPSAT
ncbi:MAG: hypothetical protein DRI37_03825 [Chloroflexi bacterium]|nr:MAG: hypothetical protein DRI37_03825 [Chloroflexota bacterium]